MNKQMNVMIVDDYQTMRGVIRNLFNLNGFENTEEAGSVEDALTLLREKPFDLVIFDWYTGAMSGAEFLKTVRADARLKNIPFLVVSAESNPETMAEIKAAGASDFIAKPFNKATLSKRLTALFGE